MGWWLGFLGVALEFPTTGTSLQDALQGVATRNQRQLWRQSEQLEVPVFHGSETYSSLGVSWRRRFKTYLLKDHAFLSKTDMARRDDLFLP